MAEAKGDAQLTASLYLATATDSEKETMALLHASVDTKGCREYSTDAYARLRFVRARPKKPEQAVAMYEEAIAWRREYGADAFAGHGGADGGAGGGADGGVDGGAAAEVGVGQGAEVRAIRVEILAPCPVVQAYYSVAWCGPDPEGRPVLVMRFNRTDFPGILRESTMEHLFARNVALYEEALRLYRGAQFVAVIDINTATFVKDTNVGSWIKCMLRFVKALSKLEAYYPEVIYKIAFVNQPWMFGAVWRMIKPFLAAATVRKVR